MSAAGLFAWTAAAVLGGPTPLFNPLTAGAPLTPRELVAGPLGLLLFLPVVPLVLWLARWRRRGALGLGGVLWLVPTLGWAASAVLLVGLAVSVGWIWFLGALRRRGRLGRRGMIALVWIGLHVLVLPLWWCAHPTWYPSRMAVLHNAGFAYLMLRLIAWGVEWAGQPSLPVRLLDTMVWLLYPPCMRLGPLVLRRDFLERFEAWDPRHSPRWRDGARRLGLCVLGGVALAIIGRQIPGVGAAGETIFAQPAAYSTAALLRAAYLIPVQVYLLLWTYNELAAALGLWLGIRVDDNFNWLPCATSVRDFWRRWHITLGAWLRDQIYIPLGGNRRHVNVNIAAVFGYCAVWHGAAWSFLAWGASQVMALGLQRATAAPVQRLGRGRLWTALCWLLTMQYQLATIVVFVDFEHCGVRLFTELWQRIF